VYDGGVGERRSAGRGRPDRGRDDRGRRRGAAVFWAAFFVVVAGLFLMNRGRIQQTVEETGFLDRLTLGPGAPRPPAAQAPPDWDPIWDLPALEEEDAAADSAAAPDETAGEAGAAPAPVPETKERALYFIQRDREGALPRVRVLRALPVSGSPLLDSLKALLAGPTAGESAGGLVSLIPEGARVLRAAVKDGTAYIDMSEEFLFNTYGVQGYEGGLQQLVWTATEFPSVARVQVLIEGKIEDFLGESVNIGTPRNRESF